MHITLKIGCDSVNRMWFVTMRDDVAANYVGCAWGESVCMWRVCM